MVKRRKKTQDEAMSDAFVAGTLPEEDRRAPETDAATPAPTGASQGSGPIGAEVGTPAPIGSAEPVLEKFSEVTVEGHVVHGHRPHSEALGHAGSVLDVIREVVAHVGRRHPQPIQVHPHIPASPHHLVFEGGA